MNDLQTNEVRRTQGRGLQRVIAYILVLVLLIATYPSAAFALDSIILTIDSSHCAVTDAETGEKLPNTMHFEEPTEVSFCIMPDKGYTLQTVTANGEALEPTDYGIYTLKVEAEMTLTVSALDTLVPVIELSSVEPEGWAQEKYITVNVSDNSGEVAVYCSKNAYTMAAELNTALANGEASLVTEGKSTVTEAGTWYIYAVDAAGNLSYIEVEVTEIDTEAPVFQSIYTDNGDAWCTSAMLHIEATDTQSGVECISVALGEESIAVTYEDAGKAVCKLEKNGIYTITAIDKVGNKASQSFEMKLIDTDAPVITVVSKSYEDGVWRNEPAALEIRFSDAKSGLAGYAYTIGTEEYTESASKWHRFTLTGAEATETITIPDNGTHSLRVVAFDALGNQTAEMSYGPIMVDTEAPALTASYSLLGEHFIGMLTAILPESLLFRDAIPVEINASDAYSGLATLEYQLTDAETPAEDAWVQIESFSEKCIKLLHGDNDSGLVYIRVTDAAGNCTVVRVSGDTTDRYTLENTPESGFDAQKPTITARAGDAAYPEGEWTNKDVTLTFEGCVFTSGVDHYEYIIYTTELPTEENWISGSEITFTEDTNCTVRVRGVSRTGIPSDYKEFEVKIQKTLPENASVALPEPDGTNGWYRTLPEVTVTAPEAALRSAPITTHIRVTELVYDNGELKEISVEFLLGEQDISFKPEGTYRLTVWTTDTAGNTCEAAFEKTLKIDTVAPDKPTIRALAGDAAYQEGKWTNSDVTLKFTSFSLTSGIDHFEYIAYTTELPAEESWTSGGEITFTEDTNCTVRVRAVSGAGIASEYAEFTVKIQKTLPENAAVSLPEPDGTNGWHRTMPKPAVTAPVVDPRSAPVTTHLRVTELVFDETGKLTEKPVEFLLGEQEISFNPEGTYRLAIWTTDAAGNTCETAFEETLKIDTVAPAQLVLYSADKDLTYAEGSETAIYNTPILVSVAGEWYEGRYADYNEKVDRWLGNEGASVLAYYMIVADEAEYSDASEKWTPFTPAEGIDLATNQNIIVYLKAVDRAGNATIIRSTRILLDDRKPEPVEFTYAAPNENGFYNTDLTVSVKAADEIAEGVASGIASATYAVYADGTQTQSGSLPVNTSQKVDSSLVISAARNNTNDVRIKVTVTDISGNTTVTESDMLKFDVTAPRIAVSYDNNTAKERDGKYYFDAGRTATIVVSERNFDASRTIVSLVNQETGRTMPVTEWRAEGTATHIAQVKVDADGHYTLRVSAMDAADNADAGTSYIQGAVAPQDFIVDMTAPKISVRYDNNSVSNGSYFKAPRTATITITEHNLDKDSIKVLLTAADGTAPKLTQWTTVGDTHTASVTFSEDTDYRFGISCADLAGNQSAATDYGNDAAPERFTVDTELDTFEITGVENGAAYTGEVIPSIKVEDIHLDQVTVCLKRIVFAETEDVTELLLTQKSETENAFEMTFGGIDAVRENDGLYILTVDALDRAGNVQSKEIRFTVNRFGSVYVFDSFVEGVCGSFNHEIASDLIITEYNPSGIAPQKASVIVTKDGTPIDIEYTREIENEAQAGKNAWYAYRYTISREAFSADGIYSLSVSGVDNAGVASDTAEYLDIAFVVDNTLPELTVMGLDEDIINASGDYTVQFIAFDAMQLQSICVYVNNQLVAEYQNGKDFTDATEFTGEFRLNEGLYQTVRFVLTDKTGNVTDSDSADYLGALFCKTVTVSGNFFVRLYANKAAFIAAIAGCVLLIAAGVMIPLATRKRKKVKKT